MVYFGQEVGEPGNENGGFGSHSRTSIFDYVGVPNHQRWMNGGKFDGGQLSDSEKQLRDFYKRLLNLSIKNEAMAGSYREIHRANLNAGLGYDAGLFSFVRWSGDERLVVVINFNQNTSVNCELVLPNDIVKEWGLKDGSYELADLLYGKAQTQLEVANGTGKARLSLQPQESFIFQLK